jgi:membrane protein implicated in regulation of membrane protease activity
MTALLDDHMWIAWLVVILGLIVVEMRRLDLAALCGGVAALAALLAGLFGAHWWLQVLVALAAAVALLRGARPALLRALPVDSPSTERRRHADDVDPSADDAPPAA